MVIVREKNIGYWGIQVFYTEIIRLFFLQKIRLRLAWGRSQSQYLGPCNCPIHFSCCFVHFFKIWNTTMITYGLCENFVHLVKPETSTKMYIPCLFRIDTDLQSVINFIHILQVCTQCSYLSRDFGPCLGLSTHFSLLLCRSSKLLAVTSSASPAG